MNTAEDRNWQIDECSKVWHSFEYFLDQYVYIEDKENNRAIKLELWPMQRGIVPNLVNDLLLILLKTRQVGLTWLSAALVLWLGIRNPLFLALIISVNEDLSIEFLNRVYFILDRLPAWLYPPIKTRTKQVLEFRHYDGLVSTIKSMPTTEMGAQSKTPNILILDETCMNRMIGDIFNSSYPGIEQAKGRVVVISNSIKRGPGWGWTRDLYTNSMAGLNQFKRIFLPWQAHPGRPANFRKLMENAGMDAEDVVQHYPETEQEAIEATSGSYFGNSLKRHTSERTAKGAQGRLIKTIQGEIEFVKDAKGPMTVWFHPYHLRPNWDGVFWTARHSIGSDVSEGLGNTYSVVYVKDRLRDEIIAKIKSNRIDAVDWAEQIDLLSHYYGNHIDRSEGERFKVDKETALCCVEVNGSGQTTVKELIKRHVRQYVRIVPDVAGSGLTKQYGWPETQDAKYELANDLKQWFKTMKGRLYDAVLIDQCSIFIRHENGKLGHEEGVGKYDDDVIGAGLTEQASLQMGEAPKPIVPPVTGWRAKIKSKTKAETIWAT
jgi:hypothetical protein